MDTFEYKRQETNFLLKIEFLNYPIMPTLCYQQRYPRTKTIRKIWLAKRVIEYFASCLAMLFIFGQYVHPILVTAAEIHSTEGYSLRFFGRILKMSVPCVMCWILFFFANFQAVANICSELTYFADREFFKVRYFFANLQEWWNCRTFAEYWKLWNLPVHNWILKHMYYPMLRKNMSPILSNCISFFVSAVQHEYMMATSFFLPTWYFFVGMFANFFAIVGETILNKVSFLN